MIPVKKLSERFSAHDSVRNEIALAPRRLQCHLEMDVHKRADYIEPISESRRFAAGGAQ